MVGLPLYVLPLGDERTASSRARVYALLPHLRQAGIDCRVLSPYDPEALAPVLDSCAKTPTLIIQKRLLDDRWRHRLVRAGVRLLFDLDDAYFAYAPTESPDRPAHRLRVAARRRHLARMVQASAVTVCGNAFLSAYARRLGAKAAVIPTCLDLAAYPQKAPAPPPAVPVIGWIGSATNLPYLEVVRPALSALCRRGVPFVFSVVCDRAPDWPDLPVRFVPWTASGWSAALRRRIGEAGRRTGVRVGHVFRAGHPYPVPPEHVNANLHPPQRTFRIFKPRFVPFPPVTCPFPQRVSPLRQFKQR